jgi:putative transposase
MSLSSSQQQHRYQSLRIGWSIDVGILNFLATYSGKTYPNPRPFKTLQRKLKLLQKRVSRKVKKSNNRKKAQVKVSELHEKIANIRKDYY